MGRVWPKAGVQISLHFRKTWSNGWTTKHNRRERSWKHSNKNINAITNERATFSETEMTNVWRAGGQWILGWIQGAKAIGKRSQDGGSNDFNLGRYLGKRRNANRGVERGLRGLKKCMAKISFHSDPMERDNAPSTFTLPLGQAEIYRRKTIGDKKKIRRTPREIS